MYLRVINLLCKNQYDKLNFFYAMNEVSLVVFPIICYVIFFRAFRIDDLIEENGYKVLQLPPYYYNFNPTELV